MQTKRRVDGGREGGGMEEGKVGQEHSKREQLASTYTPRGPRKKGEAPRKGAAVAQPRMGLDSTGSQPQPQPVRPKPDPGPAQVRDWRTGGLAGPNPGHQSNAQTPIEMHIARALRRHSF